MFWRIGVSGMFQGVADAGSTDMRMSSRGMGPGVARPDAVGGFVCRLTLRAVIDSAGLAVVPLCNAPFVPDVANDHGRRLAVRGMEKWLPAARGWIPLTRWHARRESFRAARVARRRS